MLRVRCYNVHRDSLDCFAVMEWETGRMTSRRFKDIVRTLFQYSCENGIDAKDLAAVVSNETNILFSVTCIAEHQAEQYSAIDARIKIFPHAGPERVDYRVMNIAS